MQAQLRRTIEYTICIHFKHIQSTHPPLQRAQDTAQRPLPSRTQGSAPPWWWRCCYPAGSSSWLSPPPGRVVAKHRGSHRHCRPSYVVHEAASSMALGQAFLIKHHRYCSSQQGSVGELMRACACTYLVSEHPLPEVKELIAISASSQHCTIASIDKSCARSSSSL